MVGKLLGAILLGILSIGPAAAKAPSFKVEPRQSYSDYPSFKLWIPFGSDHDCSVNIVKLSERLYPLTTTFVSPEIVYWIDGQPSGPTIKVNISGMRLNPEKCLYSVVTHVVNFANDGYNFPNFTAEYFEIGPNFTFSSNDPDSQATELEKIIVSQLAFFFKVYRAESSGSHPLP